MKKLNLLSILILLCFSMVFSQENPLPLNIQKAYAAETRSSDGLPGSAYWQNSSNYQIDVEVDTEADRVSGKAVITYFNNSPDTLTHMVFRLYQDFFRKGNARQWAITEEDITEGVKITRLEIDGIAYNPDQDFPWYWSTNVRIRLKNEILPGATATIETDWGFDIPAGQGLRMKKYNEGHYFIAYWYPQIAVYDDIDGWDEIEYLGMVEFYNDINNFLVNITVPGDFIVWATGELQNMQEVFQPGIVNRIQQAKASDEVTRIITQKDYENKAVTNKSKTHTWTFKANNVPDFSFAMSKSSNWDGSSLVVDASTGRRVFTDVVYPPTANHWDKGAELSRNAIEYMSTTLPGVPFPYPEMTSFCSGSRGGGMETPMMANDGAPRKYIDFAELLFHEMAHTYFPFYMGTNERKYAWMDEGWATYLPTEFTKEIDPQSNYLKETVEGYISLAGQEVEMPLMVPSFQLNDFSSARVAAYTRPAMAYHFLRDAMGDSLFKKALKEYMNRWKGKHPLPWDFFNTFDEVAGESLHWFWKPWFFEAGYPDLAINVVTDNNEVIIERIGTHPIPIALTYETEMKKEFYYLTTATWKTGEKMIKVFLPKDIVLKKVVLGNDRIPDVDKSNNSWSK